ncbi:hypothetical protein MPH_05728 [Macrophomina phaseolina MS6]|uniref:Uncharacterized protein n=1 Tax=Macrophomina phaseolina (strain MS6) TaxID=1126212 RepID=K2S3J5_MACPH|nr:hypothetical protein MPH_05728 [Macrophomina phaseolina MS6]
MELRAHKDIMVFWNGVPEWEGAMLTPAKRSIEEKALEKDSELELEEQKGAHLAKRFYLWAKYKFQPPKKHDKRAAEMDDGEPVSFRHAEDKEEIMRLKEEQRKEWAKDRFVDKADGGF